MSEENKADFEACWGGKFVYMCKTHMLKLLAVGTAMGTPVDYKEYNGEQTCKNCEREKQKQ